KNKGHPVAGGLPAGREVLLKLSEHLKRVFVIGLAVKGIHLGEDDLAFLVHDEDGAFVDPRNGIALAQDAKFAGRLAVRPKVARQRIPQYSDVALLPRQVAGDGIYADAHDLG